MKRLFEGEDQEKRKKEIISVQNNSDVDDEDSESETEQMGRKSLLNLKPKAVLKENRQRVLLVPSRGITFRYRHLFQDLNLLLPHSKKDVKLDSKSKLEDLNEMAELNNCNNCIYFETRKHQDMYMWLAKTPMGPSVKFQVNNVHTLDELKMTGNCLKGSRPILSFDAQFDDEPYLRLLKELFSQIFGTPKTSRKIKPFVDRTMSFSILDNKIWIRNYQIVLGSLAEEGVKKHEAPISLVEIGPRFVLEIMRIFDGAFGGSTLYENPDFITPNNQRRLLKGKTVIKHQKRLQSKMERTKKLENARMEQDPLDDVFK